jgi:hypothetical protein
METNVVCWKSLSKDAYNLVKEVLKEHKKNKKKIIVRLTTSALTIATEYAVNLVSLKS